MTKQEFIAKAKQFVAPCYMTQGDILELAEAAVELGLELCLYKDKEYSCGIWKDGHWMGTLYSESDLGNCIAAALFCVAGDHPDWLQEE
jgi:hypothetical protein